MARPTKAGAPTGTSTQTELETIARRLASELGCVIDASPPHARTVRGMSEWLKIDRNVCQKVLAASAEQGPLALVLAPGPKSLHAFLAAAKKQGVSASVIDGARRAVDRFHELIGRHGSHTHLKNLAKRTADSSAEREGPFDDERIRRKHFTLSSELMGLQMDARIVATLITPTPDGSRIAAYGTQAMVGCVGTGGRGMHTPLIASSRSLYDDGAKSTQAFESRLLKPFCSDSISLMSSRHQREYAVDAIELPVEGENESPIDLVTTTEVFLDAKTEHIARRDLTTAAAVNQPARRFILDLFVHKQLGAGRVPTAQSYFWNVNLADQQCARRWFDQLPASPRLEVLQPRTPHIDAGVWPRQTELYDHLHAAIGIPAEEFIGYRLQATYPITGTQYRIALEPGAV